MPVVSYLLQPLSMLVQLIRSLQSINHQVHCQVEIHLLLVRSHHLEEVALEELLRQRPLLGERCPAGTHVTFELWQHFFDYYHV